MNDELSKLLKCWDAETPAPPGFRGRVWARVEAEESSGIVPRLWAWIEGIFPASPHPGLAIFAAAAAIMVGTLIGSGFAESDGAQNYLRSVNPYAHVEDR